MGTALLAPFGSFADASPEVSGGWKDDLPPAAIRQRLQGFIRERSRRVRIRCDYGLGYPELPAIVTPFEMKPLAEISLMRGFYGA